MGGVQLHSPAVKQPITMMINIHHGRPIIQGKSRYGHAYLKHILLELLIINKFVSGCIERDTTNSGPKIMEICKSRIMHSDCTFDLCIPVHQIREPATSIGPITYLNQSDRVCQYFLRQKEVDVRLCSNIDHIGRADQGYSN